MESELISIIVPVYKVEKYLSKCLDSIISQTYKNLEIILVDDGSPDSSGKICDEYAIKDQRIQVIHKENGGVATARNCALDIAKGEYIGFVDSDDWIEPDMYEFLINNIKKYNADISMCGETIYENGEISVNKADGSVVEMDCNMAKKETVIGGSMGLIWNKIYKKSVVENVRFSPEYGCSEDLLFVYQCVANSSKILLDNQSKYSYFRREGGITKGEFGYGAFGVVDVMKKMLEAERGTEIYPYCVKGVVDATYTVLSGVITSGKCQDRFDQLIAEILKYRKDIFTSNLFEMKDRIKCILITISPKLYRKAIKMNKNM